MKQETGHCRPYRAWMSPEACRKNRGVKRDGCLNCRGLEAVAPAAPPKTAAAPLEAMPPRPANYHEALRAAVKAKGWTIAKLAAASGLGYSAVGHWLTGLYRPLLGNARILDRTLGVSLAEEYKDQLPEQMGAPRKDRPGLSPGPRPARQCAGAGTGGRGRKARLSLDRGPAVADATAGPADDAPARGSVAEAGRIDELKAPPAPEAGKSVELEAPPAPPPVEADQPPAPGLKLSAEDMAELNDNLKALAEHIRENRELLMDNLNKGIAQMFEMAAAALRAAATELALDRRRGGFED